MTEKELLIALVADAQQTGLGGKAFAEYLAERILLAGGSVDWEKTLKLLLSAPTIDRAQNTLKTAVEMIRIRYAAACGLEKAILGDVLNLLEGGYVKEPCF